jgi:hypothetical protein
MNGYLMQQQKFVQGEDLFIESFSSESSYGIVFEDDGDTAYFYAVQRDAEGNGQQILDALHIYETTKTKKKKKTSELMIIWSKDWLKCALVIDAACHAIFDFEKQAGYNINEFPPPNSFWTKHERKLTNEIIQNLF